MEKSKNSINVEGGFWFCGGWNFSKLVLVGSTFIREMRVGSNDLNFYYLPAFSLGSPSARNFSGTAGADR